MERSKEYLKRLEALNGGPLRNREVAPRDTPSRAEPAPFEYRRAPTVGSSPTTPYHAPRRMVKLDEVITGEEIPILERGVAYCITTPIATLDGHRELGQRFQRALGRDNAHLPRRLAQRCAIDAVMPDDVLFLDLETTGLGVTPLFLIGALSWQDGDLVARQYLARHYGEEAAATALFMNLAHNKRLLISFNGKSFDWPFLRLRAAVNTVPCLLSCPHFDLLHEARRIWRGRLPNCKLQTLEQHVCGRPPRAGDIPGADIPQAYHDFVRTGNAAQMAQIIHHNLLDLVTMAELMVLLPPLEP